MIPRVIAFGDAKFDSSMRGKISALLRESLKQSKRWQNMIKIQHLFTLTNIISVKYAITVGKGSWNITRSHLVKYTLCSNAKIVLQSRNAM
jgi:hypothetical protein